MLSLIIYKDTFSFSFKNKLILLIFSLTLNWTAALSSSKSHTCYSSVLNHLVLVYLLGRKAMLI